MSRPPAMNVLAFLDIGFAELVVVAFVALVLFGGRLPEVMRTLGQTYRNFRRGVEGLTRETTKVFDLRPPQTPYRPTPPPAQGTAPWMPVTAPPPVPMPTAHPAAPLAQATLPAPAPAAPLASPPPRTPAPGDDEPPPI